MESVDLHKITLYLSFKDLYAPLSSNFVMREFPGKNPAGSFRYKSLETILFQGFFAALKRDQHEELVLFQTR